MFSYFNNYSAAILSNDIANNYSIFVLDCLKKYGITRENAQDYQNRVFIERVPSIYSEECTVERDRYFIDGKYCFTIEKEPSYDINNDGYISGYRFECRVVVDE